VGGSGLDQTDDFQKFCSSRLDPIQSLRIRIGLELKNFTVGSSLLRAVAASNSRDHKPRLICSIIACSCHIPYIRCCSSHTFRSCWLVNREFSATPVEVLQHYHGFSVPLHDKPDELV